MKRGLLVLCLVCIGCEAAAPMPPKAEKTTVELIDITYAGLDRAIADEKGHVVLVDVWATWCGPCVEKFPHFVELHEKYAAKGLVCISASTDEEETKAKALKFLTDQKAMFANYRFSEKNDKIAKELNEKYPTDLQPIMFVFNKAGVKVKEFKGNAKPEEMESLVEELLGEK